MVRWVLLLLEVYHSFFQRKGDECQNGPCETYTDTKNGAKYYDNDEKRRYLKPKWQNKNLLKLCFFFFFLHRIGDECQNGPCETYPEANNGDEYCENDGECENRIRTDESVSKATFT